VIIVGVDPGATTGLVKIHTTEIPLDRKKRRFSARVIEHAQLPFDEAVYWIDSQLPICDVLAVERFTISTRTITGSRGGANDAMHVIGACRALALFNDTRMVLQTPADAKSAFSDVVLRSINVYNQVSGGHARDALRHALLAHRRQK
jgi:hypothetical protein